MGVNKRHGLTPFCLCVFQKLDASYNRLQEVPISTLSAMTALSHLSLGCQWLDDDQTFKVSSSLLPILHPGLVLLDLVQHGAWERMSLFHLGQAMTDLLGRATSPTFTF